MYIAYICKACRKEFILLAEEVQATKRANNYIACPHCGSKKVKECKVADSLKECMDARSYERVNGGLRQR